MFPSFFPPSVFQLQRRVPPPVRRVFTREEDLKLKDLVSRYGEKNWKLISSKMQNRTIRQCRERYKDYLHPGVVNGPWQADEDLLLREKYHEFGPKWSLMTPFFPERSAANLKNRWAFFASRDRFDPFSQSETQEFEVTTEIPPATENPSEAIAPAQEQQEEDKGLISLYGLELNADDWDSEESKLFRFGLRKCFPNHAGDHW
jgi:hypothetical protein